MNRGQILSEADRIVHTDRNAQYGDPEDNFQVIANYWAVYLESKYGLNGSPVDATDVASMMVLMKMARIATSPEQEDHWVDIAGYAACGGEVATRVRSGSGEVVSSAGPAA